MKSIEEKLWDYIDGTCTADEQKAISLLIETDKAYQDKYHALLQLNSEFNSMELDEPSMPFTYNVMEAIRTEQAQKPLKASINTYIIKGIAIFFVLVIAGLLIAFLSTTDWPAGSETVNSLKLPNLNSVLNGSVLNAFLFFDTVIGLLFLDTFLRKRRFLKHQ
ncbi:hypothetical protein GCM10027049_05870 [Mucilaginibacter puniceus]